MEDLSASRVLTLNVSLRSSENIKYGQPLFSWARNLIEERKKAPPVREYWCYFYTIMFFPREDLSSSHGAERENPWERGCLFARHVIA